MPSYAERQKPFQERKRAEDERREFEQLIINNPFSSSTTDVEKYKKFQSHHQTLKVYERKRKRAEGACERRKRSKQDLLKLLYLKIGATTGLSKPVESNEDISKRN